ncbi:hypothetical protein [Caballeronia novacaledonica]|uniref:hypothetical protein n=1 Tax=Caballeronia novacaledonica TaxID=1544861 RepID=UPI0015E75A27|nr:hypothetical protein [Caballeronia novacaledonica]
MNSPVFCRKLKAWRARSVALASSDRLGGFVGESGIACGAAPSLRTIFPVKNVFGYCGYSGSDNAGRAHTRRNAPCQLRARIFLMLDALQSEHRRACRSTESRSKFGNRTFRRAGRIVRAREKERYFLKKIDA